MQIDDWVTYDSLHNGKVIAYDCWWFTEDKKYHQARFNEDELELV